MIYLLDTNVVSELARNPRGPLSREIGRVGEDRVMTSIVVAAELRFGYAKRGDTALSRRVKAILAQIAVHPFETPADARYGEIRADLERRGDVIGANDLLIAAHALNLDAVVVTDNVGEVRRVQGLVVENWLNVGA